ncbi:stigma-specific STIG1-like protein 1 [Cannabis sativa]|uniref:stigma-specific STIG1-like protein 1 n=1 Tax=Cannabis sativa TaxID=3483 RepID=UPI0011DF2BEE|nr:stigma-specific STIG1-like protein 1 [Cannabis sativa]
MKMKFIITKLFFILIMGLSNMAMSPNIASAASIHQQDHDDDHHHKNNGEIVYNKELSSSSFWNQKHEEERFFWPIRKRANRRPTCKNIPRICLAKGSPGPSCCKKKCVDFVRDRHNCGKCGKKCKYNQICCNGKCVNHSFNKRHCGGCNNKCSNGGFCAFGLCSYA